MADIVTDLAEKSGVSPDQARQGLGAVLAFARESLPADEFAQVSAAVPGSDQLMAAAGPREESSGGILGKIKDAAGKLFGGGGAAALTARLAGLGLSAEQAKTFLARVTDFFRGKLPDAVTKHLNGLIPTPEPTPA
jgi:hypothetical protein